MAYSNTKCEPKELGNAPADDVIAILPTSPDGNTDPESPKLSENP